MASDPKRVQAVFLQVADLPPDARAAVLDRECGPDADLRGRVESLLGAHDQPDAFLDTPVIHPIGPGPAEYTVGSCVGPYRLRQRLGQGGMGTVWAADQESPVRRRVAVKFINPGLDSGQVIRRFEAERQALALMDHPNIATILDAGVDDRGRPYFVMELVKGVPATTYCDELNLGVRDRLELFAPICRAVQHAHQKGIIHRDLKPANVLVCIQDGRPVPKVIDFGIAKALDRSLIDADSTAVGAVVGTLTYMSPEQAELSALDVDTRADVYGLGGLLYELLTGTPPLEIDQLKTVPFTETLRVIREDDPPRPSARLSTADGPLDAKRTARAREVRGDLDWIVMKCLEKDRTRRYDTASGLVRDIERYLNDEPIEARPPSAVYRASKFVRRHRRAAVAGGAVAAALVLGLVGTTAGMVRANSERTKAEQRLAQVERGADIFAAMFEDLDPQAAAKEGVSLRVILGRHLDKAAALLDGDAIGDPLTVARLQYALGTSYVGLGYPKKAVGLLEPARRTRDAELGPTHADTLAAMNALAGAYRDAGRLKDALPLYEETLRRRRAAFGDADRRTLDTMHNLAVVYREAGRLKDARPLAVEVHRRTSEAHGPESEDTLAALLHLAAYHRDAGDWDAAIGQCRFVYDVRKRDLGEKAQATMRARSNLACTYLDAGRAEDALRISQANLADQKHELGEPHLETIGTMGEIGVACRKLRNYDDAIKWGREALRRRTDTLGRNHPHTLISMNNLALTLDEAGRTAEARTLFEETLRLTNSELGAGHPDTLRAMCNVATMHRDAGEFAAAIALYERARARMPSVIDGDHPLYLDCTLYLIESYLMDDQTDPALPLIPDYLNTQTVRLGADSPQLADILARLGRELVDAGQLRAGENVMEETLRIRKLTKPNDWKTHDADIALGWCLFLKHEFAEAAERMSRGYRALKQQEKWLPQPARPLLPAVADRLIFLYMVTWNHAEVKHWCAERAKYPPWTKQD
jgi:eukaryotic-like serine/threonine-protein kinase